MKVVLLVSYLLLFTCIFSNGQEKTNPNGYNIIYYPNGKVLSEGYMKDGKPDGYWKSYYTTGIIKSEGNRKNFLLDSIWIFYNSTGDTLQKMNYLMGKKNGYYYEYFTDRAKIDEYGKVISKELYVNDSKEGKSFYYSGGKLTEEVNYEKNKRHGLSIEYDYSGKIITIKKYNKGSITEREKINRYNDRNEKDGIWKEFYDNIKVKIEENYKDGLLNGYHKEYDLQGKLMLTLLYENGKLINETLIDEKPLIVKEVKDSSGNVIESGPYMENIAVGLHKKFDRQGNIISSSIYNNNGTLLSSGIVDKEGKREGEWKDFFGDGKVKAKGLYKNNLREGNWLFYFNNGNTEQVGSYRNGKETGIWKWYYSTGELLKEENYFKGKKEGISTEYAKNGEILMDGGYVENEKEGEWKIKINDFTAKGNYVGDFRNGIWKYYYDNNNLLFQGEFIQGNPEGKHMYFYPDKKVKEEQHFVNGIPDKHWKKFDEEGNLIVTITYEKGKEYRINGVKIDLPDQKVKID